MAKLQQVENALKSINETKFQELCDCYLVLRNSNYSAILRPGTQIGKQKTVKGVPDFLIVLPNGLYVLVEHSTDITKGYKKLKTSVENCLDFEKTKIPVRQIAEVILCMNFDIKPEQVEEINSLLGNTHIRLTLLTLQQLSIELYYNHKNLLYEYLGLNFDTGQIVSLDTFVAEYNKVAGAVATPLDNEFLFRQNERVELENAIADCDIIIVTGAPGVGKTRLCIESIKNFLSVHPDYQAYAVSYKDCDLLYDLHSYFNGMQNSILFVDDANRIDSFSQILGFYKQEREKKLKIILTVRDYALEDVSKLTRSFRSIKIVISKLPDDQIASIAAGAPFKITTSEYIEKIIEIADGNPRIAIMVAKLAVSEQRIQALSDVFDLFESYFLTFVDDKGELKNIQNVQCLGLISFFQILPYKDENNITPILNKFGLSFESFTNTIDKLDRLELVELRYNYVKIPEQNLATYFFYKAFIKESNLSFRILLQHFFDSHGNMFRDCVIPANNNFGPRKVMETLKPQLQEHWRTIFSDESREKFLSTFWFYLFHETLEFIHDKIQLLPSTNSEEYSFERKREYGRNVNNHLVDLLKEFFVFYQDYEGVLRTALELSFELVRKKTDLFAEVLDEISGKVSFDVDDYHNYYYRQKTLLSILTNGLRKEDILLTTFFFKMSSHLLKFSYQHTRGGRNSSIQLYRFNLPNTDDIREFRATIWSEIKDKFPKFPNLAFELMKEYAKPNPDTAKDIMESDLPYVVSIIESNLSSSSFEHCQYVQDQIWWFKQNSISSSKFESLKRKYVNDLYKMSLKLSWDRLRNRELYDKMDYHQFEKEKEAEIREYFRFKTKTDVIAFYDSFASLFSKSKDQFNYSLAFDCILDETGLNDFELGLFMLELIIRKGNMTSYVPARFFATALVDQDKEVRIWSVLNCDQYVQKGPWKLSYFYNLNDSLIRKEHCNRIILTVQELEESFFMAFVRLEKYLLVDEKLFLNILKVVVEKNKNVSRFTISNDIFTKYFHNVSFDLQLVKEAYIQQENLTRHFDFQGEGFLNILILDGSFLLQFVRNHFSKERSFGHSYENGELNMIWSVPNIEEHLTPAFLFAVQNDFYLGISSHYCNVFFTAMQPEYLQRAGDFLTAYVKMNYLDTKSMNAVVDVTRHSMRNLFEPILLLYLTLDQDEIRFSKIYWRRNGSGGLVTPDVIFADIEAGEWQQILTIVEKSHLGIEIYKIKAYIRRKIEDCIANGEHERQMRFLRRF